MSFTPVTSITNFSPDTMVVGQEYELTATVNPSGATNQKIDWLVPNNKATMRIAGGRTYITPIVDGTLNVKAVIKNGKQA